MKKYRIMTRKRSRIFSETRDLRIKGCATIGLCSSRDKESVLVNRVAFKNSETSVLYEYEALTNYDKYLLSSQGLMENGTTIKSD